MIKRTILSLLLILPVLSCEYVTDRLNFTQPEIRSVSPAPFAEGVPDTASVRIEFSEKMDTVKTNQAFALTGASGSIRGFFSWESGDRVLVFTPSGPLTDGNRFVITVGRDAEDVHGNDLKEAHESVFFLNADITPPRVVSHTPARGAIGIHPSPADDPALYGDSIIRIIFSEPMDIDALYRGFTISPSVDGLFSWNVPLTEATFTPVYPLSYGTTYTVSLGSAVTDLRGNGLEEQYSYSFTVGDDFTGPELLSVTQGAAPAWVEDIVNTGAEKDGNITLSFDEPVTRNSLLDALSLSPSQPFRIIAPEESATPTIVFDEPLESETEYTLTVSTSLKDRCGNPSAREHRYRFLTDGPGSKRPEVSGITDASQGYPAAGFTYWSATSVEPLTHASPYAGVNAVFNTEMDPVKINIEIRWVLGSSGSSTPKVINRWWPDVNPIGPFQVCSFDIEGLMVGNTYRLIIRKESADKRGNTLKEDFVRYFKVEL